MSITRNLRLLAAFNFCTDFRFYAPVAILYFAQVAGSYALGMMVFSVIFVSQTLLEMPTGLLSDKWLQRKGSMICGAACSAIGIALYAQANSYHWLLAGAVLEGASRSFYSGTTEALLYETLQQTGRGEEFHHAQGRVGSMFQFSAFVGALIGAAALLHSYQLALWLSVIPQIACFIIAWFFVEPKRHTPAITANIYAHTKEAFAQFARNPRLRWLSVANVVNYSFGEAGHQFSAAYVRTLIPAWSINLVRAIANLCSATSFWFAGRLIDFFGYFKIWGCSR